MHSLAQALSLKVFGGKSKGVQLESPHTVDSKLSLGANANFVYHYLLVSIAYHP